MDNVCGACVAITASSNHSMPSRVRTDTRPPCVAPKPASRDRSRVTASTGVARRTRPMRGANLSTYWRDPPVTVNHCGRSRTCSRPWLWQKRISVPTGKRSICTVEHDQMQPIIGKR
jgi:hypothetical protein